VPVVFREALAAGGTEFTDVVWSSGRCPGCGLHQPESTSIVEKHCGTSCVKV
jgi:hypothetical protein